MFVKVDAKDLVKNLSLDGLQELIRSAEEQMQEIKDFVLSDEQIRMIEIGQYIQVIKDLRADTDMSLVVCKAVVDIYKETYSFHSDMEKAWKP